MHSLKLTFPHSKNCEGCRDGRMCNHCGKPLMPFTRCTYGRCPECHTKKCPDHGDQR